jgi:hypothetical protein
MTCDTGYIEHMKLFVFNTWHLAFLMSETVGVCLTSETAYVIQVTHRALKNDTMLV